MKKLIYKDIFAYVGVSKAFLKTKEHGENIQDAESLAEELQKYPCLNEKRNEGYKEIYRKENPWRAVEQFLIVYL